MKLKFLKKAQAPEIWKVIAIVLALLFLGVAIYLIWRFILGGGAAGFETIINKTNETIEKNVSKIFERIG